MTKLIGLLTGNDAPEVVDGFFEALFEGNGGLPAELFLGQGDVGLALEGIVAGERMEGELGTATDLLENELGELEHGEFSGVADIDRTGDAFRVHEADEAFDEVVDIAEGAGLGAVTVDGDVFPFEGLDDEVGNNATVVRQHSWSVGVEDADHADIDVVLTMVIEKERLRAAFAFVVAGADTDGVDAAFIGLRLGVDFRIPVDLGSGGLEDAGFDSLGQSETVDGSHHGRFGRLDGIELVVGWGGGAGKVVDLVDLKLEGVDHIMANQLKVGIGKQVGDVRFPAGEEVIEADHFVAFVEKAFTKMGAEETGTAGDENSHVGNFERAAIRDSALLWTQW